MFNNDGDMITKVWMLLDIIHKAASGGPALARWADAAREELDTTHSALKEAGFEPVAEVPPAEPELPFDKPQAIPTSSFRLNGNNNE